MDSKTVDLTRIEFQTRYAEVFQKRPSMSLEQFYGILKSFDFNEKRAYYACLHTEINSATSPKCQLAEQGDNGMLIKGSKDVTSESSATLSLRSANSQRAPSRTSEWQGFSDSDLDAENSWLESKTENADISPTKSNGSRQESPIDLDEDQNSDSEQQNQSYMIISDSEPSSSGDNSDDADDSDDDIEILGSRHRVGFRDEGTTPGKRNQKNRNAKPASASASASASVTAVTPWIGRLAAGLFVRTLIVCDGRDSLGGLGREAAGHVDGLNADADGVDAIIDITVDPEALRREGWKGSERTEVISWKGPCRWKEDSRTGYGAVSVDGTKIKPGDYVMVRQPKGDSASRLDKATKRATTSIWYARVIYLYEDRHGEPMMHLRWLEHGGNTILEELAGPRELFLLSECDDNPVGSIAGKIEVEYVGMDERTGHDGLGTVETQYKEKNHYFYRQFYDGEIERFEDPRPYEDDPLKLGLATCRCCQLIKLKEQAKITTLLDDSMSDHHGKNRINSIKHRGTIYKRYDFVYFLLDDNNKLYGIGQIRSFKFSQGTQAHSNPQPGREVSIEVEIDIFKRYDDLLPSYWSEAKTGFSRRDNRRLYLTQRSLKISMDKVDGKCHIWHASDIHNLNAYKDFDENTFYVQDKDSRGLLEDSPKLENLVPLHRDEFRRTSDHDLELVIEMSKLEEYKKNGPKLRAMEIFVGAGGLAAGLDLSGAVDMKWAVDDNSKACHTTGRNNPNARVYNHDANVILRRAIDEHNGTAFGNLRGLNDEVLPPLPKSGEIDFLCGGPPCQDFSRCNRFPKADSFKNSLLTTYLSYVEFYRPKYFLLENVQELINHRIAATQNGQHSTTGGIENGSLKFILRALTSLGYQCTYGVLNALEHGVPQSRRRLFVLGAAPGHELPRYPEPSHFAIGVRATKYSRRTTRGAPHAAITAGDAMTDLPRFDYDIRNPTESVQRRAERRSRADTIRQVPIPIYIRSSNMGVGQDVDQYASKPLSEYQRILRQGMPEGEKLRHHVTERYNDENMLRVFRIPMKPGANHMDLPAHQDADGLRSAKSAAWRHNYYPDRFRRIDMSRPMQTCLTKPAPNGKNGTVVHPYCFRLITVREQGRAMGLPDTFTWDIETHGPRDMMKEIGNMVVVPVGRSLGLSFRKCIMKEWFKRREAEQNIMHSIEVDEGDYIEID